MPNLFDITGDVAVVTGAGRGIGRGIAQALADAGAYVICAARRENEIEETAALINQAHGSNRAIAVRTDVTVAADMDALADVAVRQFGRLDIWVNNAGGSPVSMPLVELPEEEWHRTMAVNLTSVFYGVRAAVRHLGDKSRILNTSSLAGQDPFPGSGHYSAAKAGVNMLTKTLAHELGPKTRINTILPGFVPTETVKIALKMADEDFPALEQQLNLPAGRLGTPEDIGAAALYFCSPASEWVTGQCFRVAGTP
ncbi:glucose 1-dehydrogenase [Altererythrobacter sp. H2]|uniref:SDR family NAD(P)-dependent oxidoreductase n=1 Tax=Altererythrobacter sp. H2 TaxID=3108391 RepID=UPI002B4BF3A8|nr:glucose 1-dehydrogenase [Altererythrobacter sp. H2]WRK94313.1 glucose 1-dehydrogenase [Altererythrobacter sp. H2]